LIKHIGVTNFDSAHLNIALASGIPIVSNQICHSVIDQRAMGEMSKVCEKHGVKILAFGTLMGGLLSDKWLGKSEPTMEELKTWSQMKYKRFIDAGGGWEVYQNLLQVLKKVADKHEVSVANIASRFVLENPHVAAVIIGARLGESEHIEDNKKLLNIDLDVADVASIKEAQSQLKSIPGDCGDEYRKPPFLTASGDLSDHLETFPPVFEPITINENRQ
jgi:aryl-alcohol dehydrogenase-like predicted oxidoreductase